MAYRAHTLLAFGGTLTEQTGQDEIWECTVRGISPGGSTLPLSDPAGYMAEIATPLGNWFGSTQLGAASDSRLTFLKVNNIGTDGRYSDPDSNVFDYPSPIPGPSEQQAPSFCSLAISWTTARTRPPGAFGRIYPPNYSWLSSGSSVGGAIAQSVMLAGVALLDVIRNCSGTLQMLPVIASKANATNTEITGVRVGNVYDVQRRRKNAVREVYNATAWDSSCG